MAEKHTNAVISVVAGISIVTLAVLCLVGVNMTKNNNSNTQSAIAEKGSDSSISGTLDFSSIMNSSYKPNDSFNDNSSSAQAVKGDTSAKGDKGDTGAAGKDGDDGLSAYEIYLKYHSDYCGDEEEWANDLAEGKLNTKLIITFDTDEGTIIDPVSVNYRSKAEAPADPTKKYYEFTRWTLNGEEFDFTDYIFTESITLKANWYDTRINLGSALAIVKDDGTYEIADYNEEYGTDVEIPEEYNGVAITSIAADAFAGNTEITSVTLSDNITSIGEGAFEGCTNLTCVDLPDEITSIGKYAFSGCTSLTSIDIPSGVTEIKDYTFSGCTALTSVELPESVTTIDEGAFSNCTSLTTITMDGVITYIGEDVLLGCTSLETVDYNAVTFTGKNTEVSYDPNIAQVFSDDYSYYSYVWNPVSVYDLFDFEGSWSMSRSQDDNGVTHVVYQKNNP